MIIATLAKFEAGLILAVAVVAIVAILWWTRK